MDSGTALGRRRVGAGRRWAPPTGVGAEAALRGTDHETGCGTAPGGTEKSRCGTALRGTDKHDGTDKGLKFHEISVVGGGV